MKKIIAFFLAVTMLLSLIACGTEIPKNSDTQLPTSSTTLSMSTTPTTAPTAPSTTVLPPPPTTAPSSPESTDKPVDYSYTIDLTGVTSLEDLEVRIEEHLASTIASLNSQWETLAEEIDTYVKYVEDTERVFAFYQTVIDETEKMCIMLYEYTAAYSRMILDSDMSAADKYKAIDGINDCLYDDACDEIHDEIYEGLLDDMKDYYYEDILNDAKDNIDYSDWYDICADEYKQWYDTSSEVYSLYYDAASEIYSFYYDMARELYGRDLERAEKIYERFLKKIAKAKGQGNATDTNATFDTTLRTASTTEELETVVDAHVSECVQALWIEWETFSAEVSTFDKYMENVDAVEAFHGHIEDAASQILIMICNYGSVYADIILQSALSSKDMYKAFEDFKDCIYEDACKVVKDEIYEDLLGEIKDYYYEGIVKDAKDSIQYGDWSDARSDAYRWWSDTRGAVYRDWSDTRGDLYSFYSDVRSELYSGDTEGASDELQDFKEKIAKMK